MPYYYQTEYITQRQVKRLNKLIGVERRFTGRRQKSLWSVLIYGRIIFEVSSPRKTELIAQKIILESNEFWDGKEMLLSVKSIGVRKGE